MYDSYRTGHLLNGRTTLLTSCIEWDTLPAGPSYYPSVRTENKGLQTTLFSVHQMRWIDYNFKSEIEGNRKPKHN